MFLARYEAPRWVDDLSPNDHHSNLTLTHSDLSSKYKPSWLPIWREREREKKRKGWEWERERERECVKQKLPFSLMPCWAHTQNKKFNFRSKLNPISHKLNYKPTSNYNSPYSMVQNKILLSPTTSQVAQLNLMGQLIFKINIFAHNTHTSYDDVTYAS